MGLAPRDGHLVDSEVAELRKTGNRPVTGFWRAPARILFETIPQVDNGLLCGQGAARNLYGFRL